MATTLNNYSTLANATILAGSADLVSDGFSVYLDGKLFNAGTLAMDANANGDSLILVGAAVSLVGGGTVLFSDNPKNYIYGGSADDYTLINVNNTIEGAGYLGQTSGYQPIAFTNEAAGIVDADDGAPLVIETSGMTAFNEGELEATDAGGLVIYGSIIDQTGGSEILASGAGTVYLEGGADILGGTLSDVSGGDIDVFSGGRRLARHRPAG